MHPSPPREYRLGARPRSALRRYGVTKRNAAGERPPGDVRSSVAQRETAAPSENVSTSNPSQRFASAKRLKNSL